MTAYYLALINQGSVNRGFQTVVYRPRRLSRGFNLEAQQRYFSYRAILVAIVSKTSFVPVFMGVLHNYRAICCKMGYRTDVPV